MSAIISMQLFNWLKDLESNYQQINKQLASIGENLSNQEIEQLANEAVNFAREK